AEALPASRNRGVRCDMDVVSDRQRPMASDKNEIVDDYVRSYANCFRTQNSGQRIHPHILTLSGKTRTIIAHKKSSATRKSSSEKGGCGSGGQTRVMVRSGTSVSNPETGRTDLGPLSSYAAIYFKTLNFRALTQIMPAAVT